MLGDNFVIDEDIDFGRDAELVDEALFNEASLF